MGKDSTDDCDYEPTHAVALDGFWIGQCEITNDQYAAFLTTVQPTNVNPWLDIGETDCGIEDVDGVYRAKEGLGLHPVVYVTWHGAKAYCDYYGYDLPTEAQWEYAARGPNEYTYPWGNTWDKSKCCNYGNQGPYGRTFEVGHFPEGASWCGALDMAGNVWEWCADWYASDYYEASPLLNPPGPADGSMRGMPRGRLGWQNQFVCRLCARCHQPELRVLSLRVPGFVGRRCRQRPNSHTIRPVGGPGR